MSFSYKKDIDSYHSVNKASANYLTTKSNNTLEDFYSYLNEYNQYMNNMYSYSKSANTQFNIIGTSMIRLVSTNIILSTIP